MLSTFTNGKFWWGKNRFLIEKYCSFFTGANQLLWYYADLEKQRCYNQDERPPDPSTQLLPGNISVANVTGNFQTIEVDINHCLAWRRFAK